MPTASIKSAAREASAWLSPLTMGRRAVSPENTRRVEGKAGAGRLFYHRCFRRGSADLLKREYAEGHELGNHTGPPSFNDISRTQIDVELSLTERLMESELESRPCCSGALRY